jgi:pSer/pThr/pTyr-binding forkhead associated (FHA) protein
VQEEDPLLLSIDKLIRLSRLKEIEFIMTNDQAERLRGIRAALRRLQPGQYLLGTGPSTVGIIPLNSRDVTLGRPPTLFETPCEAKPDHWAIDTLYFVPREVSRAHARLVARSTEAGLRHRLIDLNSTCGTFVNQVRLERAGDGVPLKHGDVISLGPSQTSTYVYYHVPFTPTSET